MYFLVTWQKQIIQKDAIYFYSYISTHTLSVVEIYSLHPYAKRVVSVTTNHSDCKILFQINANSFNFKYFIFVSFTDDALTDDTTPLTENDQGMIIIV